MSVTSVSLDFAGATGKASRGGKREYTAHYIAQTDDKLDQPFVVLDHFRDTSSLPHPDKATSYSYGNDSDSRAICDSLEPRRDSNNPFVWRVIAHFGDAQSPTEGQDENGNPTDNPEDFALDVQFRYNKVRRPVTQAKYITGFNGDAAARFDALPEPWKPCNSAFVPYDPPIERDALTEILSITGNFGGIVDGEFTGKWVNVVNNSRYTFFNINGFSYGADAYLSKIQNISPVRKITAGFSYWRITFEIETDRELGWRLKLLDEGFSRRRAPGDPNNDGGSIGTADLANIDARVEAIVDERGHPVQEKVLFNGDGLPLANPLADDPVYSTWAIYPEQDFTQIPLLGQLLN